MQGNCAWEGTITRRKLMRKRLLAEQAVFADGVEMFQQTDVKTIVRVGTAEGLTNLLA